MRDVSVLPDTPVKSIFVPPQNPLVWEDRSALRHAFPSFSAMEDTAMLSIKACRSVLLPAAFAISAMLLAAPASRADTLNYTFSGVGSGAITGNTNTTFTNANFSINFTEDP